MDSTVLAGIYSAAGALFGAVGGAFLAGRSAVRQARTSGREQQRNWLLEQRLEAYVELCTASDATWAAMNTAVGGLDPAGQPVDPVTARTGITAAKSQLNRAVRRVQLAGPEGPLIVLARILAARVTGASLLIGNTPGHNPQYEQARNEYHVTEKQFIEAARHVLHSDQIQ
ncbi:hypothetical protein ACWDQL_13255 [Streptomyces olivaceus]